MKDIPISVIVPVYNGEKTLKKCLDSILRQKYKNYEIIVVNNNSTDNTKNIIQDFQKSHRRVKYVFEKYRSRGAARNAGIRESRGEIIAMTDSDCIVPRNWIEELTRFIRQKNESAVMGFEEDLIKNYWTRNAQKADWEFAKRNVDGMYISHVDTKNFAIESALMKKFMFDSSIGSSEDFDLYLRLKEDVKIRFIPSLRVKHYHKSSFTKYIASNLSRGFWATKLYKKHTNTVARNGVYVFESISLKNFLGLPFWIALRFIKKTPKETFFTLVSELSWRVGILYGLGNCYLINHTNAK